MKEVVLYPDSPLTKRAVPYESVGADVAKLAGDMFEIMEANDGCGLAGPQVGVGKRIIVLREPEATIEMCLINPEILEREGQVDAEEGCLSLPGVFAIVSRSQRVRARALNERGAPVEIEAEGLIARIIQHEIDHLEGLVFLDRVDILTREDKLREWAEIREQIHAALAGG